MCATSGARTAHPSGAHEFNPLFLVGLMLLLSLVFRVVFCRYCVICPSSIYRFGLKLWDFQNRLIYVKRFKT